MHFHSQMSGWLRQCLSDYIILSGRHEVYVIRANSAQPPPKKMCPYAYERVITKSHDREAGVRFVITSY